MLIFDEHNKAILIDSISTPLTTEYFWVLDLEIMDYTITPILMLAELITPTVTLNIRGFEFDLPSNWNVLVFSPETSQLDIVLAGELAGQDFSAVVYGPSQSMVESGNIKLTNYSSEQIHYCPAMAKHQMLCHPISPTSWINVAPSDAYNKYLKDCVLGDII